MPTFPSTALFPSTRTFPSGPKLIHVREKPKLRQHIDVVTPSGRHYRWGEDEPLPENVFADLRHSSTMPGGYETCEVTLPRKPGVDYSDLERLSTLTIYGVGGEVDGEYRLERAPRVSGDQMAITPSAVGWQAHLEDNKSARMIYRDIDLSRWGAMPAQRKINLIGTGFGTGDAESTQDPASGAPSLRCAVSQPWQSTDRPISEAWYDAGSGLRIGSVYYAWKRGPNLDNTDTNWTWAVLATDDDVPSSTDNSGNLRAAGPGVGTLATTNGNKRFAQAQLYYAAVTVAANPNREHDLYWTLAVYGTHGLALQGTEPDAGFHASDIVRHAVQTWAPLLNIKPDSIQQSSFVIPHLVFLEPTTASEIIRQASRFNLPDWAVWDKREFVWHEQGTRGKRWRARIGPSQLEETGPQLDRLWESVIVSYQDVDGSTRTVGPPGSGADSEDTVLKDPDPENPANKLGITRRDLLAMGTSTAAGATEVGRRFLEQTKLLDSSGRAQLVGWVEDDRGAKYPYSRVRAGDGISFVDASDTSYRRIVRADHTRQSRSCSIDLDAPPDGLQALLERLGVVLVPLGF